MPDPHGGIMRYSTIRYDTERRIVEEPARAHSFERMILGGDGEPGSEAAVSPDHQPGWKTTDIESGTAGPEAQ
mgnify:CR=1 FL=1